MYSDSAAAKATAGDENSMVEQTSLSTEIKAGLQSGGGGIDGPARYFIFTRRVIDHQDGGAKRDSLPPCCIAFSVGCRLTVTVTWRRVEGRRIGADHA